MIAHLAVKLSIPTYLAIIANNVSYEHNVVQYYVTKSDPNYILIFLKCSGMAVILMDFVQNQKIQTGSTCEYVNIFPSI